MNHAYFWGTGGWESDQLWMYGQEFVNILVKPGISPPQIYPTRDWSGSWITACDASFRCVTVAPHDPPSTAGINMSYMSAQNGGGMITMLGDFSITSGIDKGIRVYVFPYPFWAAPTGVDIRTRLLQLRGWL